MINKTQEVWVNKEFEDDLDNSQSVKKKSQIVLINLKKNLNKYYRNNLLERGKKKFEDAQLLEEVQDFVENTKSNIPTETLENVIKRMSNRI